MKIEAGKRYVTRDGRVVGPMVPHGNPHDNARHYTWKAAGTEDGAADVWTDDGGYFFSGGMADEDLVSEYVEPAPPVVEYTGQDSYALAADDALAEVRRAKAAWPGDFNSAHEGFAILNEEFDELRGHVWTNQKRRDLAAMRKEAIQVAAMALRFAAEVCDETRGRK